MTPPRRRDGLVSSLLAGLVLIIAGCSPASSSGREATELLPSTTSPPSSAANTRSQTSSADPTGSPSSANDDGPTPASPTTAEALRNFVADNEDIPDSVQQFINATSDQGLEALATEACGLIEPDMSRSELGTATYEARASLSDDDQALLDIADFGVVFGATAGLACPERLPIGVDPPPEPRNQALIDGYRQAVPNYWSPDQAPSRFVAGIGDDRLNELQGSACRFSAAGQSATEFGTAVLAHHSAELTPDERAAISPTDYAEVYGSLIGWFCPERLPSID